LLDCMHILSLQTYYFGIAFSLWHAFKNFYIIGFKNSLNLHHN
jgi:hypothetical protein